MQEEIRRTRHAELALELASEDQRLLDILRQRPYLLNPYPSILTRLARRSRRFRLKASRAPARLRTAPRQMAVAAPGR